MRIAFVRRDPNDSTATSGPYGWDALTHLCFSRYLRLDAARSDAFVRTARALLDAGASAKTGWYETIDHPNPRPLFESAIYGAAAIARHAELTRLLLERGADPNDEETPYHVPETNDNTVMRILLESGALNTVSLNWMLLRKTDWHDLEGLRLLLAHNADPRQMTRFGDDALHQDGDSYFDIAKDSTALHVASWRGWPDVVKELIARGAPVHATDGKGRTALALAVKACVDSHWTLRRSPESVRALLDAGASVAGVELPTGYDEVDTLLRQHAG
jgi:ankyrin repeat protein